MKTKIDIADIADFLDQVWTMPAIVIVLATVFYPLLVLFVWSPILLTANWIAGLFGHVVRVKFE
jgi:capsular polysaccharide biosynthesis protein